VIFQMITRRFVSSAACSLIGFCIVIYHELPYLTMLYLKESNFYVIMFESLLCIIILIIEMFRHE